MWNKKSAVIFAQKNAGQNSLGLCATYVRQAIEAGGVTLIRHLFAKDYGTSLTAVGFQCPATVPAKYLAGDVGIVQPITGHPAGHIAIFDGSFWLSDFKQLHGLYPGIAYRQFKPAYSIYRYPGP